MQGMFKWNWQILFLRTPQKSERNILLVASRFLNCILFLFYALTIVQLLRHWCSVGLDRRVRVVFSSNFPFFCEAEFVECAGLSASLFVQIGGACFCLCLCWGQNSQHHTFSFGCNWNMWPLRRNLTQISSAPPVWDFDLVKSFCSNFCPLELLKAISVIAHKLAGCCWNADFLKRTR